MGNRDFDEWRSTFRESISTYNYYVDFSKVYKNVKDIEIQLNILNTLIGKENIEEVFDEIITKYPDTIECIPILLAIRGSEIYAGENGNSKKYIFEKGKMTAEDCKCFMRETGLFDLLSKHVVNNLVDYVTGVEVGLDSNARKNRGGSIMEKLVEKYIEDAGFVKGVTYFPQMKAKEIEEKWNLDLSAITNNGVVTKIFDFVIKTDNCVYVVETNFYSSGGSKLNEVARSYKTIALEAEKVQGLRFIWITDGVGWNSAEKNLRETFDVLRDVYCIHDLEEAVLKELFV